MKATITLAALFALLLLPAPQLMAQVDPFAEEDPPAVVIEEEVVEEEIVEEEPSYETDNVVIKPRIEMFMQLPRQAYGGMLTNGSSMGYVDNRHAWASLWVLCNNTKPMPKVDFTQELVVYYFYLNSTVKIPAVAYVTDGTLSLQPLLYRVDLPRVGDYFWLQAQVIPREGLNRFSAGGGMELIPGNYLAEPANPTTP